MLTTDALKLLCLIADHDAAGTAPSLEELRALSGLDTDIVEDSLDELTAPPARLVLRVIGRYELENRKPALELVASFRAELRDNAAAATEIVPGIRSRRSPLAERTLSC